MPDDPDFDAQDAGALRGLYENEAAARAAAEARVAALEARELFRGAGLDPANNLHSAVMRGYQGEMTQEAIAAYVADVLPPASPPPAGQPAPPPQPAAPAVNPADYTAIAEASRDSMVNESGAVDPAVQATLRDLEAQMEVAARRGNNTELDRLVVEHSRARGNMTKWDAPNREEPSIPPGTPRMPVVTRPTGPLYG